MDGFPYYRFISKSNCDAREADTATKDTAYSDVGSEIEVKDWGPVMAWLQLLLSEFARG
jgi:hypothetical protein